MSAVPHLTIPDLAQPALALQWHEAVALVSALGADALARKATLMPEPEAFGLSVTGEAAVYLDAPANTPVVRQLARALTMLLEHASAPDPLRTLARLAVNAPDTERLDEFLTALRFYERPNRDAILADVAARAVQQSPELSAEAALSRIQERLRGREVERRKEHRVARGPLIAWPRWATGSRVAAALLVVAGVGIGTAIVFSRPAIGRQVRDRIASWFATPPAAAPAAEPAAEPAAAGTRRARRGPSPSSPSASAPAIATGGESLQPTASAAGAEDPIAATVPGSPDDAPVRVTIPAATSPAADVPPPNVTATAPAADDVVYDAGDGSVRPPALLRDRLPKEPPPDMSPQEVGIVAVWVDTRGDVERVQLVGGANRMQDRMLLAALKAWKFRPATKEGVPVRYRTEVRITW